MAVHTAVIALTVAPSALQDAVPCVKAQVQALLASQTPVLVLLDSHAVAEQVGSLCIL
jgi:hypothetical protein